MGQDQESIYPKESSPLPPPPLDQDAEVVGIEDWSDVSVDQLTMYYVRLHIVNLGRPPTISKKDRSQFAAFLQRRGKMAGPLIRQLVSVHKNKFRGVVQDVSVLSHDWLMDKYAIEVRQQQMRQNGSR